MEGSPDSFDVDAAGNVVLTYTSSPRTSVVTFVCDQSVTTAQLDSATEDSAYHYRLQVTSDKACPKAPPAPPAPPPPGPGQTTTRPRPAPVGHPKDGAGLSAGSVLLLVFFLGTTSVFAIGASYRYKVRACAVTVTGLCCDCAVTVLCLCDQGQLPVFQGVRALPLPLPLSLPLSLPLALSS